MQINIEDRLVIIVGPTTTGKTILSKKIQQNSPVKSVVISHDEILSKVDKNKPQHLIDEEFRLKLIMEISNSLKNQDNKLVILDTLNINKESVLGLLMMLKMFIGYKQNITLLKMNLSMNQHIYYMNERLKKDIENNENANITKEQRMSAIVAQRCIYESNLGCLHTSYPVNNEYIIQNLELVDINYNFPKNLNLK